jgi:hypothetical protein
MLKRKELRLKQEYSVEAIMFLRGHLTESSLRACYPENGLFKMSIIVFNPRNCQLDPTNPFTTPFEYSPEVTFFQRSLNVQIYYAKCSSI